MSEGTIDQVLAGEASWCVVEGDCLEVMAGMEDGCVDHVITDPPYGVEFRDQGWDQKIPTSWLPPARRVARSGVAFTTAPTTLWDYPRPSWVAAWFRPASSSRTAYGGFNWWTPVPIYGRLALKVDGLSRHAIAYSSKDGHGHPCPKPVVLAEWLCEPAGDLILDPFAGSGTTGVAALRRGRRVILIEREPKWAELCRERLRAEEQQSDLRSARAGQVALFGGAK